MTAVGSMVAGEAPTLSVSMSSTMVGEEKIDVPQDGSESNNKDAVSHDPLHIPPFIETTVSLEQDDATRFVLSKCQLPPRKEFEPVETFVANAVKEQHEFKSDNVPVKSYKGILDAIRFKNDPVMLQRLLLALRTAGNGSTLQFLASSASKHARLIHNIVRLNPFLLPEPTTPVDADQGTQPSQSAVNYDLPDAYLHLMMALVSANSLFLVPTMSSLWNFLTSQMMDAPAEV
jgi:RNA polymerase I-specific transcription initiation factor RRN3